MSVVTMILVKIENGYNNCGKIKNYFDRKSEQGYNNFGKKIEKGCNNCIYSNK